METVVLILATYAATVILTGSDGPYGIFARTRRIKPLGALRCFVCCSVYVGAVIALYVAENPLQWLLTALALSGGAVFLDRLTMEDL